MVKKEMSSEAVFKAALRHVQSVSGGPKLNNEQKLRFYALFKQISNGPNLSSAPSRFKFVKRAKWDAWKKLSSMSKEAAMKEYIRTLIVIDRRFESEVPPTLLSKL